MKAAAAEVRYMAEEKVVVVVRYMAEMVGEENCVGMVG